MNHEIEANNTEPLDNLKNENSIKSAKPIVPLGLRKKAICMQVLMTLLANLSVISSGMGFSFPAITFDTLTNNVSSNSMTLTKEEASWFASIFSIAVPIGCLVSSYILDLFGRKMTLALIDVLTIFSWGLMALSSQTNRDTMYIELMIGRFFNGISAGLCASPGTVYCAEVVQKEVRGKVIIATTIFIASGMLLSYVWGYFLPDDWRITSFFACGISILSLVILLIFVPETPTWLASKGRIEKAEKSLRFFKGLSKKSSFINSELKLDIDLLRNQTLMQNNISSESIYSKFKKPEVFKPFLIMLTFFTFQQLSGIYVIIIYAVQFSKAAGVSIDPFLSSVYIGVCRVVTTILIGFTMDKVGRRKPAMFSGISMSLCMFGIAAYVHYEVTSLKWLPIAFLVGYIFTSTLGLLTLPFTMNSEVFPQNVRGVATGLTASYGFVLCFVMVKLYPSISISFGNILIFLFFATFSLLSVMFTYCFLPETKGKTFEDIKNLFAKQKELDVKTEIKNLMSKD